MADSYYSCYDSNHYRNNNCDDVTDDRFLGHKMQHFGPQLFPARKTWEKSQSSLLCLMPTVSKATTCWQLLETMPYADCNTCSTAASNVPA